MGSEGTKREGVGQVARENGRGNAGGAVTAPGDAVTIPGGDVGKSVTRKSHQQHIRGRHAPLLGPTTVPFPRVNAGSQVAREGHLRHIRGRHAPLDGTPEALASLTKKAPAEAAKGEVNGEVANAMI